MTKLLEQAVEAVRCLPDDVQDDIAKVVLRLADDQDELPLPLTTAEETAVALSKSAASRSEFATDDEVRAVWSKHGL